MYNNDKAKNGIFKTRSKVQYQIEVTKVGSGALQATAEMRGLQVQTTATTAAMAKTTAASTATAASMRTLTLTTGAATGAMRAMSGTMMLVGMSTFPQLTLAATTATAAMSGVKAAAGALGTSAAALAPQLAVIVAGLTSIGFFLKENWQLWKMGKLDDANLKALETQVSEHAQRLKDLIIDAMEKGRLELSEFEAQTLDRMLSDPTYERLRAAQNFVAKKLPPGHFMTDRQKQVGSREEISDLERRITLTNLATESVTDLEAIHWRINQDMRDRLALYESLHAREIIGEKELMVLKEQAHITQLQELRAVKVELSDLQKLGQSVTQTFASGLAGAMVSAFREGGDAFKKFAADFAAQVAQMILQMMILRVISSTLGAFGGGAAKVAGGEAMALGTPLKAASGLAGVSSVSQATYFPKFNVVAGEAGREMFTVLAQPRVMELGGVQAVVGRAEGKRLAIIDADDLAAQKPRLAAHGLAGVTPVAHATMFPRFNLPPPPRWAANGLAGVRTISREQLTLHAPRLMELGGTQSVIGQSIAPASSAAEPERAGGGVAEIRVTMDNGLKAEIVENSIEGAVVRVTRDMRRHTALREAVKQTSS